MDKVFKKLDSYYSNNGKDKMKTLGLYIWLLVNSDEQGTCEFTTDEIAEKVGLTSRMVSRLLGALADMNLTERVLNRDEQGKITSTWLDIRTR